MKTSEPQSVNVVLTDPALLRRMHREAKQTGADTNDPAWWTQAVTKCARVHYGLDADLTVGEVAARLNCHTNTVKNYFHQGRFPSAYYRSNGIRAIRIPLADVLALANRTPVLRAA